MNSIKYWSKTEDMKAAAARYAALPWYKKLLADLKRYLTEEHGDEMP